MTTVILLLYPLNLMRFTWMTSEALFTRGGFNVPGLPTFRVMCDQLPTYKGSLIHVVSKWRVMVAPCVHPP